MPSQCLIQKQVNGLSITDRKEYKIEYQLKSGSGRVVMTFDREVRAREEAASRGLTCLRVTTITEKL